jgi:tRNA threonylcarbamoyladenosine biosynthesis protein TsaE
VILFTTTITNPEAMHEFGRHIAGQCRAGDMLILDGPLGAGKTTLVQGIGEGLNVRGPITSPTFVVSRIHPSLAQGPNLIHVDAYRLASFAEIDDLDLDSAIPDAVTVVEWGRNRVEGLAQDPLIIRITRDDNSDVRILSIEGGPRWEGITWPQVK